MPHIGPSRHSYYVYIFASVPLVVAQIVGCVGLLAIVAGVSSSVYLYKKRRIRLQIESGHCATCGYDLRASKERCPECGTPVGAAVSL